MKPLKRFLFVTFVTLMFTTPLSAQVTKVDLLGQFDKDWQQEWIERKISRKGTAYKVVTEDTNRVLMASCEGEASELWRMLNIAPAKRGKISWRWKVDKTFSGKLSEKSKMGDDFAARVYVVFEPHPVSWKTYALCYVWAAKQPVDTVFRNPYAKTVATIVLQSGKENRGKWIRESRDYVADFKTAFGHEPEMLTAVAIMVDSDNTGQNAISYYDDLVLEYGQAAKPTKKIGIMMGD